MVTKRIGIILILLFFGIKADANIIGKIFGIDAKFELFNKKTDNKFAKLEEANINAQAGINDNIVKLQNRIGKVETSFSAVTKLEAKVAAYDRSQSTSMTAGGDIKIYNDPNVLKLFISVLSVVMTSLCGFILFLLKDSRATKKWLMNEQASKARYKETLDSRNKELDKLRQEGLIK